MPKRPLPNPSVRQDFSTPSGTWFYASKNGQRHGPVNLHELLNAMVTEHYNNSTLVWTEGMLDWEPIRNVPELAAALNRHHIADVYTPSKQRSSATGQCSNQPPKNSQAQQRNRKFWSALIRSFLVAAAAALGTYFGGWLGGTIAAIFAGVWRSVRGSRNEWT